VLRPVIHRGDGHVGRTREMTSALNLLLGSNNVEGARLDVFKILQRGFAALTDNRRSVTVSGPAACDRPVDIAVGNLLRRFSGGKTYTALRRTIAIDPERAGA